MIGTAFWSWAYSITNGERKNLASSFAAKLLGLPIRLARSVASDPIIRLRVGDRALLVPWSHHLPTLLRHCPRYETEIGRLATHLSRTEGDLLMIDVGANVGDTIATLPSLERAKFLCIEGSQKYHDLLQKNYGSDARVKLLFALLADQSHQSDGVRLHEVNGTAHLAAGEGPSTGAPLLTLDDLLEKNSDFRNANFVKIDVDGYDLPVLRGATELLRRSKPCLHIELAPTYWRDYGNCGLDDGLAFLSQFGYKEILVYDNLGSFIGRDRTENPTFLPAFWDYSMKNPSRLYLNLIALHASRKDIENFYSAEASQAAAEH
jgi:FkbM family methyltransferase